MLPASVETRAVGYVSAPQRLEAPRTTDHDAAQTAEDRLQAGPYFALRSVAVSFHEGVLVLHGRVTSFFYKQMAQETVRKIEGVVRVLNEVNVIQEADGFSRGIAAGSVSRFSGGESHAGFEPKMR